MTIRFQGHAENGNIIPNEKVDLPEGKTLTVIVDDDNDPRPAGGLELFEWRTRHRLQVSADTAKIATDPEFNIENS